MAINWAVPEHAAWWVNCQDAPQRAVTAVCVDTYELGVGYVLTDEFDLTWTLAGGVVGDYAYTQYIDSRELTAGEIVIAPELTVAVFYLLPAYWDRVLAQKQLHLGVFPPCSCRYVVVP